MRREAENRMRASRSQPAEKASFAACICLPADSNHIQTEIHEPIQSRMALLLIENGKTRYNMNRILWLLGLALSLAGAVRAQTNDYPSVEIFGGPSIMRNGATAPHFSLYGGCRRNVATISDHTSASPRTSAANIPTSLEAACRSMNTCSGPDSPLAQAGRHCSPTPWSVQIHSMHRGAR